MTRASLLLILVVLLAAPTPLRAQPRYTTETQTSGPLGGIRGPAPVLVDGIAIGATPQEVLRILGTPREKTAQADWENWNWDDRGISLQFRQGRVASVIGKKITMNNRLLLRVGVPEASIKKVLGKTDACFVKRLGSIEEHDYAYVTQAVYQPNGSGLVNWGPSLTVTAQNGKVFRFFLKAR